VTGDETWVHHVTPETKEQSKQWIHDGSPCAKKAKVQKSVGKVMASVVWDENDVLLVDYLPQGATINEKYCVDVLTRLDAEIRAKHPHLKKNKSSFTMTMQGPIHATLPIQNSRNGDLQTSKLHLSAPARTSFDVTNSNKVYKAHQMLSRIWHKLIQNILSVFFLYTKIYYITNIALKNLKCNINIVKRLRGRSSNYFTCNTCGAPAIFGGDWRSPYPPKVRLEFTALILNLQTFIHLYIRTTIPCFHVIP
jgi:hypothetical protein